MHAHEVFLSLYVFMVNVNACHEGLFSYNKDRF